MRGYMPSHAHVRATVMQYAPEFASCSRCGGRFAIRDGCIVLRQESADRPRKSRPWWERVCAECKVN